jgi:phosphoglycolate phosphatase-like HAD superfamily hydrolase
MKVIIICLLALVLSACEDTSNSSTPADTSDPLPSWSDNSTKEGLLLFVSSTTDSSSSTFVQVDDRVAVFDLDGTLIVERPHYFEVEIAVDQLRTEISSDPSLAEKQPYKAISEKDDGYIRQNGHKIIEVAAEGQSLAEFQESVRKFLSSNKHVDLKQPYSNLFYAPMIELISFLTASQFDVYIVSTSQQEYIRAFAESCLGVPSNHVIGSMVEFELESGKNQVTFRRLASWWEPHNTDEGKVLRIRERTGRLPIFAAGNTSGDKAMMTVADQQSTGMVLLIDHDDASREYEYRKDAMLKLAKQENWLIASIKNDFSSLFSDACLSP